MQCVGKIKKGAEHDTEVSQLPEPCSIASSLISFFLCHPDDLISNSFWNESCVLPYFMGSSSVMGIDNSTKKPSEDGSSPWQGEAAALLLLREVK